MKKIYVLLFTLFLAGCTVSIQAVLDATKQMCSFAPTAQSIVTLLTADPNILTATDAALLICKNLGDVNKPKVTADGNISFSVVTDNAKNIEIVGKKVIK